MNRRILFCLSLCISLSLLTSGCRRDDATAPCEPGYLDCSCLAGSEPCLAIDWLCSVGKCVECDLGTQGCGCDEGACSTPGLACENGRCVSHALRPENPICYTPCLDDLVRESGEVSVCTADKLLRGCIGELGCVDGSCVRPGTEPRICFNDSGCPDFQTCIGGRCYSTCESDTECDSDWGCYRRVCRKRCNTIDRPCAGSDRACFAYDGENGYCMPVRRDPDGEQREVRGTYDVLPRSLAFTNVRTRDELTLSSDHPQPQDVIIERSYHIEYTTEGRVTITNEDDVPLHWLRFEGCDEILASGDCMVRLEPRAERKIVLREAANPVLARWDGVLTATSPVMGRKEISLSYASRPDGAWSGTMYYFASFRDKGLAEWMAGTGSIANVENAFVQRWARLKNGQLSLDEFHAVLTSTVSESWKWPLMAEYGPCGPEQVACYPFDNEQGYSIYTPNLTEAPIPTGTVPFPVTMYLRQEAPGTDPGRLVGRIATDLTLHYIGDSSVRLNLAADPASCTANAMGVVLCGVSELDATIMVGGRYALSGLSNAEVNDCRRYGDGKYDVVRTPWLIPGFAEGTAIEDGLRYQIDCRDGLLPYGDSVDPRLNRGLSAANPIPDGRTRVRRLTLVDGALINGNEIYILFKEHFESFMGASDAEGFSAYGVMRLSRDARNIEPEDFAGSLVQETRDFADDKLGVSCNPDLISEISSHFGEPLNMDSPGDLAALAGTLVHGAPAFQAEPLPSDVERVHWVCVDTGLIDNFDGNTTVPCPEGSEVRYFTLKRDDITTAWPDANLANQSCASTFALGPRGIDSSISSPTGGAGSLPGPNLDSYNQTVHVDVMSPGGCWDTVQGWARQGWVSFNSISYEIAMDPIWRCKDPTRIICQDDRWDLRVEKDFFSDDDEDAPIFLSLFGATQDAFRYKTRFRSRQGGSVGFAPTICENNSRALPYCYDPVRMDEIRERVDCAIHLYERHCHQPTRPNACGEILEPALKHNFSYTEEDVNGDGIFDRVHEGFERLFAELLIMLGDEAYTQAVAARFDLAGAAIRSFEGDLFEPPDGIKLSGSAGFEMVSLYQAAQYYQMTLDRFYALSPTLWESLDTAEHHFLTTETVTSYFTRLTRASTQKSRVWSEVAKRYHRLNRPDLARRVVQRAYTSAYLESVILSRMMLRMEVAVELRDWPEVSRQVELAQYGYRSALLRMRQVYDELTDELSLFGYPPEYIPFPALSAHDVNAFYKIIDIAKERLAAAATKEEAALAQRRDYDVDAAAFQSELAAIRMSYEKELANLCGTFAGDDGIIYPATTRYGGMSAATRRMGDPCGGVGTGRISQAMMELDLAMLELRDAQGGIDDLLARIGIEQERVAAECDIHYLTASFVFGVQGHINELERQKRISETIKETIWRAAEAAQGVADLYVSDNKTFGIPAGIMTAAYALAIAGIAGCDAAIHDYSNQIAENELLLGRWVTERECDFAIVNSNAEVKNMILDLGGIHVDIQRKLKRYYMQIAEVVGLFNEAQRLQDEQAETEQLSINVAAARNDPNVRIYKNDAVLAADRTFDAALRTAYMATRVYEYYTSQCYEPLIDLFLVRMVQYGDISLESYLAELEDAFLQFEYQYGNPDTRVQVLSLRDDILGIERSLSDGTPLSDGERTSLMRKRLADPNRLNARGHLTLPFSTRLSKLSPLTRNHKILFVEAQMLGSDLGDAVARVYLRQRGTSTVRSVTGDKIYYRFPDRTAVINAVVGQERVFSDDSVYRNERLRDRPVVNTHWELVINQRDEDANKDVNLQSLSDIILYVYYTDFTEL